MSHLMFTPGPGCVNLRQPPLHLGLGEVPIPRVDGLELATVDRNARLAEQLKASAQHHELTADLADVVEDAIYPLNLADESGKPLDGANKYTITFEKGAAPPVNAFWSITLYDQEGFQVGNVLNRFAVSSWMPFKYNSDGSLDLYFQNESSGKEMEANWLPAPKGPFNLTMRLCAPKSEALTGRWNPPAVTKVQALPGLAAQ
jgi:hypothetical protein